MKITRNLLIILALSPSSIGFAGNTGAQAVPAKSTEGHCSMSKVINEDKDDGVLTVDPWYLQTADDLRAKAQSSITCSDRPSCMNSTEKETIASATMTVNSWYLQTDSDLNPNARRTMTCEESQGHRNSARNGIKADRATQDSWYLQTADDIRAASKQPLRCNAVQNCMTSTGSDSEGTEPTSMLLGAQP
ncbi:hypothetical protein [Geothrix sp.]|jgi:hypothetical protein|uniref:hypothetical protein n=1 Tax=Geothrix sp. TaxID=1962974 RepID=UPI0025C2C0DA|nr:hypothetical protein [Geothrix sp.]